MPDAPASLAPREIVRSGLCIGCGACVADVPGAAMRWDRYGQLKPDGPADWYRTPTPAFARRCPFSPAAADENAIAERRFPEAPIADPAIGRFEQAYVGHAAEPGFREQGSSGGLVTWIAAELLRTGAVDAVVHVAPAEVRGEGEEPFFGYRISTDEATLRAGAKSRYHPIELSGVLRAIRERPGRYAVIGVPCFVKAIHLLRAQDPIVAERVTHTLGLFCGHMKSKRLVESFAWQTGARFDRVRAIDYRRKDPNRPANWYRASLTLDDGSRAEQDWWHLADGDWGAGFFQNSACNFCDDVAAETADLAFGDAWLEPYSSDGRGTNVMVVRSPEIQQLVERGLAEARLDLKPVDAAFVIETQAAGLRHRREGLAYRLTWARRGLRPRKRVSPGRGALPLRRRLVYRTRWWIATLSHPTFATARALRLPALYTGWARAALAFYQALTWSHGRLGRLFDALERRR